MDWGQYQPNICRSYTRNAMKMNEKYFYLFRTNQFGEPQKKSFKTSTAIKVKGGRGLGLIDPAIKRRNFFCGFSYRLQKKNNTYITYCCKLGFFFIKIWINWIGNYTYLFIIYFSFSLVSLLNFPSPAKRLC